MEKFIAYQTDEIFYEKKLDSREINVVENIRTEAQRKAELHRVDDDHVCVASMEKYLSELEKEVMDLKNDKLVEEVRLLLASGGEISLSSDISVRDESTESRNVIDSDTTLNFCNKVIRLDIPDATSNTGNWMGAEILGGEVVFEGTTGGIQTADNPELYCCIVRNGANLTVKGGKYIGGTTAFQSIEGIVYIEGGFFKAQTENKNYTLNCIDTAYKAGTANFVITGGTFVDFDPSNNLSEGSGTNYVAEGYKVISEVQDNGEIWYTVVAE